jgi:hypothetical protein
LGTRQGRWDDEEHRLFEEGAKLFNNDWRQIAEHVKTRTAVQCRTHAQKCEKKRKKAQDVVPTKAPEADPSGMMHTNASLLAELSNASPSRLPPSHAKAVESGPSSDETEVPAGEQGQQGHQLVAKAAVAEGPANSAPVRAPATVIAGSRPTLVAPPAKTAVEITREPATEDSPMFPSHFAHFFNKPEGYKYKRLVAAKLPPRPKLPPAPVVVPRQQEPEIRFAKGEIKARSLGHIKVRSYTFKLCSKPLSHPYSRSGIYQHCLYPRERSVGAARRRKRHEVPGQA